MERSSRAISNILFGFLLKLITMIGPFIVRVIITKTIGIEFLGVSGVFSSILSALALTEMGFASAIAYKCYGLYAKGDYSLFRNYLAYFRIVYRVVGTVIMSVGLILLPFLPSLIKEELPKGINMYAIYFALLFNTGASYFIGAYKSVVLTASQRQDIESKIALLCNSLMYLSQMIVLIAFKNYYVYLFFLPLTTVIINLLRINKTNKLFPELYAEGMIKKDDRKLIFKSVIPLIGHRLQGTIVVSADNIVISMFIGVNMVAIYNNYYTIVTALGSFVTAIYAGIQPGIGNSMAVDNIEKNYEDFKKISFAMNWIVGWMSICLICLFEDFIAIVYGTQYQLGLVTVILLALEFYIWRTFDIVMTYRDVAGKWSGDTLIPYISGTINLIINILLVKTIGINGVIISTIISFVLISIPFSIKVLFGHLFETSPRKYIASYLFTTVIIVIVGIITFFLCRQINIRFSINIILKGIVCFFVPNILFTLIWRNRREYQYLKTVLQRKIYR